MTVRKAPSYAGFRTVALQILALLAGLRALIIVVFVPLQPNGLNWVMAATAVCLLLWFSVSLVRRRVSESGGIVILWLALVGAVLGGLGLNPAELGDVSVFTTMSLVVVAASVLEMRAAVTFTVVAMLAGAVCIAVGSDLPMPTALVFVGMITTTSVVVAMLRSFLRTERDHAVGLSLTDSLTGAANRRGMAERVPALSDLAERTGQTLGCLVLDIDHFKLINDRYGHAHGDRVLADVAAAVGSVTRRSDVLVRLGGEEFALFVIVPGPDELWLLGEELRSAVAGVRGMSTEALATPPATTPLAPITVSIGGSLGSGGTDKALAALLDAADTAMYRAKQAGRDRMILSA